MGNIHTTIPDRYHQYAKQNKLSWNQLLITAIEQEMNQDPDYLKDKLQQNEAEHENILKDLQKAKEQKISRKQQMKSVHEGLMPVE